MKNTIRQNKKAALQEFLFGESIVNKPDNQGSNPTIQILENQIQSLHNKVDSLQQKVFYLETLLKNSKYPLSDAIKASNTRKTIQQGDSNLKTNNGSYYQENNQGDNLDSNTFSETSKIDFKALSDSQQYNPLISLNLKISQISSL